MKLRVGDTVQVIAGSDKGKTGEVIQILRKEDRVIVEGVNMVTKHIKPSQADPEAPVPELWSSLLPPWYWQISPVQKLQPARPPY